MSFPPLRTSSPASHKADERVDAAAHLETETLINSGTYPADNKQDVTAHAAVPPTLPKLISPQDISQGTKIQGPIHLEPDSDEAQATRRWNHQATTPSPPSRPSWSLNSEDQGSLREMGRGVLIIITTPIALTGMALYGCGMIIEGVALLLKGIGAFGGRILMKRRRAEGSPNAQWV